MNEVGEFTHHPVRRTRRFDLPSLGNGESGVP
jgi:hypothetical protein